MRGRTKVFMNGMTCLNCGNGWYDGYTWDGKKYSKTAPCPICGDQQPSSITHKEFIQKVNERDRRLYPKQFEKEKK